MRDGNWDVFQGQVFQLWNNARHIVPRPTQALPQSWRRWAGIDWGFAAPWAAEWMAQDGDGRWWIYGEMYERGVSTRAQAERIREAEETRQEEVVHVIDPATDAHVTDGPTNFDIYAMAGVGCVKADNDRIAGWQKVHDALADGPLCPVHAYLKEQGKWKGDTCPMLHVFEGAAPNLVRTLPMLPYDPIRVEDVDTKAEDHAADALRYVLQSSLTARGPIEQETESKAAPPVQYEAPSVGTATSPYAAA
jgi:hypothetical protein